MEISKNYSSSFGQESPDFTRTNMDQFMKTNHISDEKSDEDIATIPSLRQKWTLPEDQLLVQLVNIHGTNYWPSIAQMLPGRNGKQCRERWIYHLNPSIKKGDWTEQEDKVIISMQKVLGTQWSKISKLLPGRSDGNVKNRFYALERIRLKTIAKENISLMSDPLSQLAAAAMLMPTLKKADPKIHSSSSSSAPSSDVISSGGSSGNKRSRSSSTETDNETGNSEHNWKQPQQQQLQQQQQQQQQQEEGNQSRNYTANIFPPLSNHNHRVGNQGSGVRSGNDEDDYDDEVLTYVPQKKRIVITSAFTPSLSNLLSPSSSSTAFLTNPNPLTNGVVANKSIEQPHLINSSTLALQNNGYNNLNNRNNMKQNLNHNHNNNSNHHNQLISKSKNTSISESSSSSSKMTGGRTTTITTTTTTPAAAPVATMAPVRNLSLELPHLANYNGSKTWVPVQASYKNLDSYPTHYNTNNNNNNNNNSHQLQQLCKMNQYTALSPNPLFLSDMKFLGSAALLQSIHSIAYDANKIEVSNQHSIMTGLLVNTNNLIKNNSHPDHSEYDGDHNNSKNSSNHHKNKHQSLSSSSSSSSLMSSLLPMTTSSSS